MKKINLLSEDMFRVGYDKLSQIFTGIEKLDIILEGNIEKITNSIINILPTINSEIKQIADIKIASKNLSEIEFDKKYLFELTEGISENISLILSEYETEELANEFLFDAKERIVKLNKIILNSNSSTDEKKEAKEEKQTNLDTIKEIDDINIKILIINEVITKIGNISDEYNTFRKERILNKKKRLKTTFHKKEEIVELKETDINSIVTIYKNDNDNFENYLKTHYDTFNTYLKLRVCEFIIDNEIKGINTDILLNKINKNHDSKIELKIAKLKIKRDTVKNEEITKDIVLAEEFNPTKLNNDNDLFDPNSDSDYTNYHLNNKEVDIINDDEVIIEEKKENITLNDLVKSQIKKVSKKNILADEKENKLKMLNFEFMLKNEFKIFKEDKAFSEKLVNILKENYSNTVFIEALINILKLNPSYFDLFLEIEFKNEMNRGNIYFSKIAIETELIFEYLCEINKYKLEKYLNKGIISNKKTYEKSSSKVVMNEIGKIDLQKSGEDEFGKKKVRNTNSKISKPKKIRKKVVENEEDKNFRIIYSHFSANMKNIKIPNTIKYYKEIVKEYSIQSPKFYHLGKYKFELYLKEHASDRNKEFVKNILNNFSETDRDYICSNYNI